MKEHVTNQELSQVVGEELTSFVGPLLFSQPAQKQVHLMMILFCLHVPL